MIRLFYVICLFFVLSPVIATGQNNVNDLQRRRRETLKAIEETSRMLSETKSNTRTNLNKLQLLTAEIESRKTVINLLDQEIRQIGQEQYNIDREIKDLEKDLGIKKSQYAKSIRSIYSKRAKYNKLMFVLSAENINQSYRRLRYLKEYSGWQKRQGEEIMEKQKALDSKKEELEKIKSGKNELLGDQTKERNKLNVQEQKQRTMVSELKKKEKSLQKELAEQRKQAAELNRRIEQLIAEEARKSGNQTNRKSDTKGGYAMTKEEKELSGSFEKNKGRLPFPISGSYMIVGRFGQQQHQELKYVKTNNNGIDIQTKPGTEARAVFLGTVTKVFVVPGYNNSVIIRHGNYLTVYSNLSSVYVKAGDKVDTRQAIGKIYSDPENNDQTVLHFQVWKETTKQNPEFWLDK